jgi:hypothetical protein
MLLEDLSKSAIELWDHLIAGFTTAAWTTDTDLIEGLGVAKFLKSLPDRMTITFENSSHITDATATELGGFDGCISTSILFRKTVIKGAHLIFNGQAIGRHDALRGLR